MRKMNDAIRPRKSSLSFSHFSLYFSAISVSPFSSFSDFPINHSHSFIVSMSRSTFASNLTSVNFFSLKVTRALCSIFFFLVIDSFCFSPPTDLSLLRAKLITFFLLSLCDPIRCE
ncbi:unnamed protein product [Cuscuta europaea]|uniref:Uncharacterized protein n=1 Tax=Cuscuta europaea TaxID=41803 RepID=A0A9P0ZP01_CUSEU|nr:unnamed protein product [Cuscuta europaea]